MKCAKQYTNGEKVAVLNFANPFEPGGGVQRGAVAQEESLCRCSNLFESINSLGVRAGFYEYHKSNNNNMLFSDRIIFSPNVSAFKSDDIYEMPKNRFCVDVITCAAPYNVDGHDESVLIEIYKTRLTNIFEVAADNDADVLILGAFGCGVFSNPPELMAKSFKRLIQDKYYQFFTEICFPLIKSNYNKNYDVFSSVLG